MSKTVFICPLDWGLGHATRCVPLIREFISNGANVIVGADQRPLEFLKKEFPALRFISFPGYRISYPENGSMALKMALSAPGILRAIKKEHLLLQQIIKDNAIDIVVSDNRYGLYSNLAKTVFMTHQLMIKCPKSLKFLEGALYRIQKKYISKYDECWFPDTESSENLSGDLCHKYPKPHHAFFIGPLSRFSDYSLDETKPEIEYDLIAILSGPEPQRSIFEKIILTNLENIKPIKALVVQGKPESFETSQTNSGVEIFSHLPTTDLFQKIQSSKFVLCRSGYSSIMDLAYLNKQAVLVPTPGQTEQEYLAEYLTKYGMFVSQRQQNLNIEQILGEVRISKSTQTEFNNILLKERIKKLLAE